MKRITIYLFIFLALTAHSSEKTISFAAIEWPPYTSVAFEDKGLLADIASKAFEKMGYQVSIQFMSWARVMNEVKEGRIDAAIGAYFSEERANDFYYSDPIYASPLVFCQRKDVSIQYTNLRDLAGYRIGVVRGYVNSAEFDAAEFLTKDPVNTDALNLKKLLKKRVDLIVIDAMTATHILRTTMPNELDQLEFLRPTLEEKKIYLLFSKKVTGIEKKLDDINQGLVWR